MRFPVELAFTDQSEMSEALRLLRAEANGEVEPTGFGPVEEDGNIVVSFVITTVHAERRP